MARCASPARARRRLSVLVAFALLTSACTGAPAPDLVILNARVFTNDSARPWAEAVAVKGERVIAVGDSAAFRTSAGPSTRVIDAGGRVLVPGFNDARVDLPLEPPTPAGLTALDHVAVAAGVTSLQVVAGGPMRSLVTAAQQAQRRGRWRLIRSPMDGDRPQDEEPFLPPQPGVRLAASGVSWSVDDVGGRRRMPLPRLRAVLNWAYGAEDPVIVLGGDPHSVVQGLRDVGVGAVWARKRPRFDVVRPLDPSPIPAYREYGLVLTWLPKASPHWYAGDDVIIVFVTPGHVLDEGLSLAAGSGGPPAPMVVLDALLRTRPDALGRQLTREEAVRAMTWGSAYAEKAERDKGWLGPGTLADLAVLSDDVFAVAADRLPAISSVLTLVGGTIVYDPGVLTK